MRAANKAAGALAIGAALYAAAEIGLTLIAGHFLDWGRAEALPFFGFRPWCLLGAALALGLAGIEWRRRAAFYAAALLLATVSEGLMLTALGARNPWPELGWGLIGGAAVAAAGDFVIGQARWGWWSKIAASLIVAALLLAGGLRLHDRIVMAPDETVETGKLPLLLMSGLPLAWGAGDGGFLRGESSNGYRLLADEFTITNLDVLDDASLAGGRLLLLAQPRRLAPAELVRLDEWVRGGGRALILTDPLLLWPNNLPLGDGRRPPPVGMLGPLLSHWGLRLEAPEKAEVRARTLIDGGARRRLTLAAPGRLVREGGACRVEEEGLIADCAIGRGRARIVADADLMHDNLWLVPGAIYRDKYRRLADNPLIVASWLDGLAGLPRPRSVGAVAWRDPEADNGRALLLGGLPVLAAFGLGAGLRLRRRKA